jgi:hypothetical protein
MPADVPTRARSIRRRFALLSGAGLAVLAAALGVSFAGPSGTSSLSVTSSTTNFVYPVADGAAAPTNVARLKYTGATGIASAVFQAAGLVRPAWQPAAGSAGSVTTAGDIVLFDARASTLGDHTALLVSMYVTNLPNLQQAYSSFAFPVNIYRCGAAAATDCDTAGEWTQASAVIAAAPTYLTNTDGFLTFSLPVGYVYELAFDAGGSFFTISTSTPSNLEPAFYFTATPT